MNQHHYRLWSPLAGGVELLLGADASTTVPMTRGADGWWTAEADPGDGRYAFRVDDGIAIPDPRSRRQPDGVHAPSALVDTSAFSWTDSGWRGVELEGAVVYELHVGTFSPEGTFDGIVEHLDHLRDLGVTVIELMPVAAFPGRHGWGYDGVAPYAVHEPYGGPEGLARLVDAAHAAGLAVWLDVVHNHLGPSGNYLSLAGPYFTDRRHTPWGQAVNLDGPLSDEVRAYLLDNVRMWLEDYHLDGLRLDAVHELHDDRAIHLLEEMAALADEISGRTGVPRMLVAESDRNDPATVTPRATGGAGGLGLHGQWADDVHHALHTALTGESQGYYGDFAADPDALVTVLGSSPFLHAGTYSSFRGRVHGRPVDPAVTPGWRYVAALQTHDQVGNRAAGDRIGHGIPPGRQAAGAALLLTSPWTPMLFMGEEWGASTPWQYFTDHEEEELATAIREGRRREFASHGWSQEVPDPQAESTVRASTLDWDEVRREPHATMLDWYRTLLRLRRELPALRGPLGEGEVRREPAGDGEVVTVRRGDVEVVVVLGDGRLERPAEGHLRASFGEVALGDGTLVVGPDSAAILQVRP
ncbi:malto-oligosyltrehalose trehalohydrolase [Ornithinimicrobium humiphilum]|uniref:Malto-oligosyltrehalose trehalohydrolase n=1 Tax=Ornithinimicrobium humiphilum TaxID=125288 RepID=A0A543K7H5_9MICO|nr:malto-oligosyltrehalose trehalohydrolase [Ornithinimicrobium humiphilum]TQM91041.1 maltooligosyl trehalose hydrolase [Ornithinimicrobium humiphilum]